MEEGRGLSVGVITLEQRLLCAFAHWHCFALQMTEWVCIFVLGCFVFTLHYCSAGQSLYCARSAFGAFWGSIMKPLPETSVTCLNIDLTDIRAD